MDSAILNWNGNPVTGNEEIQKYLEKFPSSEYTVLCVDTQPIYGTEYFPTMSRVSY